MWTRSPACTLPALCYTSAMMLRRCCRRPRPSLPTAWRALNTEADEVIRRWAALREQVRAEWPPIHRGRLALVLGLLALTALLLVLA
jgi:hypothetical protein